MTTLDDIISKEINLYVEYCNKAAKHDQYEILYRSCAHTIFLHIAELKYQKSLPNPISLL